MERALTDCGLNPHNVTDVHGGLQHARHLLPGLPRLLKAGKMCWITDRTPHEALPLPLPVPLLHPHEASGAPRQFIRLSVWYSRHSTAKPLGVLPEAPVSDVDKFEARAG
jgi:hypothetical protein